MSDEQIYEAGGGEGGAPVRHEVTSLLSKLPTNILHDIAKSP